jgi:pimeloyl-ACP methyl ester carboxylesterase
VGDTIELPDGRRAQWWLGGADAGPLVAFLHGCPDTRRAAMTGHDAAREVGVRLLAVNRPGYGSSDPHESTQTSVADDLMSVADAVGADRLALLGMSIGGSYAVTAAAAHPDRVRVLGLVATQFGRSEPGSVREVVERLRPEFAAWVAGVAPDDPDDAALAERWRGGLPPPDAALLARVPDRDVAAAAREALAQHDGYLRDAALAFRDWDRRPEDVGCPTHLWYGELDTATPLAEGEELARRIPGARLVVRPGTTHLSTLMAHWQDVLATLRPHLD